MTDNKNKAASCKETTSKTHVNSTSKIETMQATDNAKPFAKPAKGTDKTYQTDIPITNREFINTILGKLVDEEIAFLAVVSKAGKPSEGGFSARKWEKNLVFDRDDYNNYLSFCRFTMADDGSFKRKQRYFQDCLFIVLDDIGTKVPLEKIQLEPSWAIETSQSNYQYGYILKEPVTDVNLLKKIERAICQSGVTDDGMDGYTSRLARLPVAKNHKYDPPFSCKLRVWEPERRFNPKALLEGLGIQLSSVSGAPAKKKRSNKQNFDNVISIDDFKENQVISALRAKGLYKHEIEAGKHDITCPWVAEHTGEIDGGTAYFEPNDEFPIGGFHCFHGHCEDRNIRDLHKVLGISTSQPRNKPTITLIPGEIHESVDKAEQVLAETSEFYQRGGKILSVSNESNFDKVRIELYTKEALEYKLSSLATWQKPSGADGFNVVNPCIRTISILHKNIEYRYLPPLLSISRQPYFLNDNSLVCTHGYNQVSQIYGAFDPSEYKIPTNPTKEKAKEAILLIEDLLEDFCFSNAIDKSAALAAILTASCRTSLPKAPMFHVNAPMIASGKSYLCELIALFASSEQSTPRTFPNDDEECRKALLAAFLPSPPVVEFDNLTSDIKAHQSLCTALTSSKLSDRKLQKSEIASVSTRSLILSSGNNVFPVSDMVRRCVPITLDTREETPATRVYKRPHLIEEVREKRTEYVAAALTIIQAWLQSNENLKDVKPLASYESWGHLCRKPLIWLGYPDPVENMFKAMQDDPERETLKSLLNAWFDKFQDKPVTVNEIVRESLNTSLHDVFVEIAGERASINHKRLGRYFKRHQKRTVDGYRLLRMPQKLSVAVWKVETVW